ncbi:hypothetical protein BJ508DRAFT_376565 [Ascobolus immersus RN42]|uniref:Uncharacterized protein n=1 Tax=Ascobolus immersus RN42 TaxID=1160509 RepID=A0A3N4IAR5_ASCIM|nr:hypothetical protein BJ508DRAFT_376565 [Ascobolus immersus RN42]
MAGISEIVQERTLFLKICKITWTGATSHSHIPPYERTTDKKRSAAACIRPVSVVEGENEALLKSIDHLTVSLESAHEATLETEKHTMKEIMEQRKEIEHLLQQLNNNDTQEKTPPHSTISSTTSSTPATTNAPNTPTTSSPPFIPHREVHIFKLLTAHSSDIKSWLDPNHVATTSITYSFPENEKIKAAEIASIEQTLDAFSKLTAEALRFYDGYMTRLREKSGCEWDLVWMKCFTGQFMVELVSREDEKAAQALRQKQVMECVLSKLGDKLEKVILQENYEVEGEDVTV